MHKSSLVSILIPNYNKAPYLRETLDSVLAQTYKDWECIIVDDHSTDNSWEILDQYAKKDDRIKVLKRPYHLHKGGNVCRNYAFKLSKGTFVQWFDSDDIMTEAMIENRIKEFQNNPHSDFAVFSGMNFFDKIGDGDKVFSWVFKNDQILGSLLSLDPAFLTPSCLFKKEFLEIHDQQWEPDLTILQDVVYDIQLLVLTQNIIFSRSEIDWYWRWYTDGHNVGSRRSSVSNLPSLGRFIELSFNISRMNESKFGYYHRIGCAKIFMDTKKRYGLNFYRYIIYALYKSKNISFYVLISQGFYLSVVLLLKYLNIGLSKRVKDFVILEFSKEFDLSFYHEKSNLSLYNFRLKLKEYL